MEHSPPVNRTIHVPPSILREAFNESQLPQLIESGDLQTVRLDERHLKNPQDRGEPTCTHHQMIRYLDKRGSWLVEVSQFVRPDGSFGASGRQDPNQDPKRMRVHDEIWIAGTEDDVAPPLFDSSTG